MKRGAWLAAAVLWTGAAAANIAAPPPPATVAAPTALTTSPIVVLAERLRVTCADTGIPSSCSFVAEYQLYNPTDAAVDQIAGFVGIYTSVEHATLDGSSELPSDLTEAEAKEVLASSQMDRDDAKMPRGFHVLLKPAERRTLRLAGTIELKTQTPRGYKTVPGYARHVVFGEPDARDVLFTLCYLVAPIRTWGGDPLIDIELRVPTTWEVEVKGLSAAEPGVYRSNAKASATAGRIELRAVRRGPLVTLGGLLLGIGGHIGKDGSFRLRTGFDLVTFGALTGVAYETDARRKHTVVPTVLAATPMVGLIPSWGIGAGVPVRLSPETLVGARLQFDAHLGPLGLIATFDYYPRAVAFEPALLFQVGL